MAVLHEGAFSREKIRSLPKLQTPPFSVLDGNGEAVWVGPSLVCTVKYMMKTESVGLRQPVSKGLRKDKHPEECRED